MKIALTRKKWIIAFVGLLILSSLLKTIYVLSIPGPVVYTDELLYRKRAYEIFYYQQYYTSSYPPLYPLLISLSFLTENFFLTVQIINIALSAIGTIAVWKITGLFSDNQADCFLSSLLVTLLPWQVLNAGHLMSENLYYPILMWTVYFFLKELFRETKRNIHCIIIGVMLALLQLTRHISFVLLPIFAIIWLLDINHKKRWSLRINKERIISGLCVLVGYITLYGTWILSRIRYGEKLELILGFSHSNGIGFEAITQYITLNSLCIFTILYLGYIALSVLYIFPICIKGWIQCAKGKVEKNKALAGLLLGGLSFMLLVATVRHSWRSDYNYPQPEYIIGRYVVYISVFMIIIFCSYYRDIDFKKKSFVLFQIIETVFIVVAGQILVRGNIFGLRERFLESANTKDVFYVFYAYIPIVLISILQGIVLLMKKERMYYRFTSICMIAILFVGNVYSVNYNNEKRGIFGKTLDLVNKTTDMSKYSFVINDTPAAHLDYDIEFWSGVTKHPMMTTDTFTEEKKLEELNLDTAIRKKDYYKNYQKIYLDNLSEANKINDIILNSKGLVFCPFQEEYDETPLQTCVYQNIKYGIYEYPLHLSSEIIHVYPNEIISGRGFNIQPDGTSAIAMKTNLPKGRYELYINNELCGDFVVGEEGWGSSIIPEHFYNTPNTLNFEIKLNETKEYIHFNNTCTYKIEVLSNEITDVED